MKLLPAKRRPDGQWGIHQPLTVLARRERRKGKDRQEGMDIHRGVDASSCVSVTPADANASVACCIADDNTGDGWACTSVVFSSSSPAHSKHISAGSKLMQSVDGDIWNAQSQ